MDMMAFRRAVMGGPHLETVVSGNQQDVAAIAHFSTPTPAKMHKLTVNLPYKADGYTSVNVTCAGVNLLNNYTLRDGVSRTVTYTGYKNSDGIIESVHASGTSNAANAFRNLNYDDYHPYNWPPNGAYATYGYSSKVTIIFVGDAYTPTARDGTGTGGSTGRWKVYDLAHNASNAQEWVRIQLMPYNCTNVSYNDDVYPLICLASDQGCAFEPYKGSTYTASFSKIYGGTVDLVSGKVIGTYAADGTEAASEQTITGQAINTLAGINNVWADAGTVTVNYWSH